MDAILGESCVLAALFDLCALHHVGQIAVFDTADPAGYGTVFGDRVAQPVGNHGVLVFCALTGHELIECPVSAGAVKIIRVDDGKRSVDLIGGAERGMGGSPGFDPAFRYGKALRQLVQFLEHQADVKILCHAVRHSGAEVCFDRVLDDEHHFAEARLPGVVQGKIDDGMSVVVDRGNLLETAETAAHAGSKNN